VKNTAQYWRGFYIYYQPGNWMSLPEMTSDNDDFAQSIKMQQPAKPGIEIQNNA